MGQRVYDSLEPVHARSFDEQPHPSACCCGQVAHQRVRQRPSVREPLRARPKAIHGQLGEAANGIKPLHTPRAQTLQSLYAHPARAHRAPPYPR